jgi:hypothetical protein
MPLQPIGGALSLAHRDIPWIFITPMANVGDMHLGKMAAWVKIGKPRSEHNTSGVSPDSRHGTDIPAFATGPRAAAASTGCLPHKEDHGQAVSTHFQQACD